MIVNTSQMTDLLTVLGMARSLKRSPALLADPVVAVRITSSILTAESLFAL